MSIDELRDQRTATGWRKSVRRRRQGPPSMADIGISTALAGGAYAATFVLVTAVCMAAGVTYDALRGSITEWHWLPVAVGVAAVSTLYGGLGAIVYTALVAMPVLGAVALVMQLLKWRPREDRLGVFCGGLVAGIATLPISLFFFYEAEFTGVVIFFWLVGPAASVFFGMVGGAIGGVENGLARRRHRETGAAMHSPPRFRIAQLMVVTAVVSLLLAGLKGAGLLNVPMLLTTLAWIVLQFVGRRPALQIARWWVHRQQKSWRAELAAKRKRLREALQRQEEAKPAPLTPPAPTTP